LLLPPVVHGFVERDPSTLGELATILSRRGIDLVTALKTELRERTGDAGVERSAEDRCTIILVDIPICRTEGGKPVAMSHRAFLALAGALELGVELGALFLHDNRYYKDVMSHEAATKWESQKILPMDVVSENDRAAAMMQSGIKEEGPLAGVMIGAGALGSAILNLWGRSGWGHWTVIDKDHIRPHNLSRHAALAQHIGELKADVVAGLQMAASRGAVEIFPLTADACDFTQEPVNRALTSATLVVDASTTLEYPRAASGVDDFARQISIFITPNGNAAVLLAEDAARSVRLRTLEAQYYRALIQAKWGRAHLLATPQSFWSGASCRDISMVMPYSRVMAQASILAEQIPVATACDDAVIRIWQRDSQKGRVDVYEVPVAAEQCLNLGELDLFIDDGVEQQLRELRAQEAPNETGGALLGYYDFNISAVIIVAGLPAPPDSKSSPDSFERGVQGLLDAVGDASKRTGGVVQYVGEWHSHPPGHSASPSGDDFIQLVHLALGMADDGLPAVQLIVGERDLQVIQGTVA
jgi:hypothetical protein